MPNLIIRPKAEIAAPGDGTFTITHHRQAAEDFLKALATVSAMIPLLEAANAAEVEFVRTHQNVPVAFIQTAIAGVEQTPELQTFTELDPVLSAEMLQFIEAFRPVLHQATTFTDSLKFTLDWKVAKLTHGALACYQIVKGAVRGRRSASAVSLLANLTRDLGLRASRARSAVAKGKAKAATEAAPVAEQPKADAATVAAPPKPDAAHVTAPPKEVKA
jgi:hypothetical protein